MAATSPEEHENAIKFDYPMFSDVMTSEAFGEQLQGFRAAVGAQHPIATQLQAPAQQLSVVRHVVHHQDRMLRGGFGGRFMLGRGDAHGCLGVADS